LGMEKIGGHNWKGQGQRRTYFGKGATLGEGRLQKKGGNRGEL